MKTVMILLAVTLLAAPAFGLTYNQNVTPDVIFGTGNANGHFTVATANGVELGLRGKVRFNANGQPENTFHEVNDNYYFLAGVAVGQSYPTPTWAFEWTVNTDVDGTGNGMVGDFTYELGLDFDPGPGTNYVVFDPITPTPSAPYWDHAMGDNTTGNGDGVVASDSTTYASYLQAYNVAQNSWRYNWFDGNGTFNPSDTGTYEIYLAALSSGTEVARTHITIHVYNGPTANEDTTWGRLKSLFR